MDVYERKKGEVLECLRQINVLCSQAIAHSERMLALLDDRPAEAAAVYRETLGLPAALFPCSGTACRGMARTHGGKCERCSK